MAQWWRITCCLLTHYWSVSGYIGQGDTGTRTNFPRTIFFNMNINLIELHNKDRILIL